MEILSFLKASLFLHQFILICRDKNNVDYFIKKKKKTTKLANVNFMSQQIQLFSLFIDSFTNFSDLNNNNLVFSRLNIDKSQTKDILFYSILGRERDNFIQFDYIYIYRYRDILKIFV